ncbi:MAG: hypothetical protein JWP12_349 [Bacteroidetes bacterium]|nr:hypothetical protein [Bacteroidota bacterium]
MSIKKNIAISESGFIFDPSTGNSFTTNPIGLEILQLIKEGREQNEIKKHITAGYHVDDNTFEKDFYDFISTLQQLKLTVENEKKND